MYKPEISGWDAGCSRLRISLVQGCGRVLSEPPLLQCYSTVLCRKLLTFVHWYEPPYTGFSGLNVSVSPRTNLPPGAARLARQRLG